MSSVPAYKACGFRIEVKVGDITRLERHVGAIVSSDDNYLSAGGGVSAAIRYAAEEPSLETRVRSFLDEHGRSRLSAGSAFVTPAGKLDAERIVHAVVIDLDRSWASEVGIVRGATRAALDRAADLRSIAFPILASGVGGLSQTDAATAIASEIIEFAFLPHGILREAILIAFEDSGADELHRAVARANSERSETRRLADSAARRWLNRSLDALQKPEQRLSTTFGLFDEVFEILAYLANSSPQGQSTSSGSSAGDLFALIEKARGAGGTKWNSFVTQLGGQGRTLELLRHIVGERNRIVDAAGQDMWKADALTHDLERVLAALSTVGQDHELSVVGSREARKQSVTFLKGDGTVDADQQKAPRFSATVKFGEQMKSSLRNEVPDDPTIRLAKFLQDHLNPEQRSYLQSVFRLNRYSGGFELELVEYCLERDPIELLREMFAKPGLMKICAEVTNKTASGLLNFSEDDLAQKVLGALGFSTVSRVRGIVDATDAIEKAKSKLSTATDMTLIRGAIVEGGQTFERIAGELLALYAAIFFGQPWHKELVSRRLLSEAAIPTRLSLGSVIESLVQLDRFLAKRIELVAWTRWRELVGGKPILGNVGTKAQNITKVRNDVSHYREYVEKMTLSELRELGDTMFKDVLLPLVRYIETEGIYPRIIVVREYVRDAYGRHFVNAEDDRGERHKIFTTDDLDPSLSYFLFPRTNRTLVYPLLIPRPQPIKKPPAGANLAVAS